MADYSITEVVIAGVPLRMGDRIAFTYQGQRFTGMVHGCGTATSGPRPPIRQYVAVDIVDRFPPDPDDEPTTVLGHTADVLEDVVNITRERDERHAIVTERYPTAWDRVLDGGGTP